MLTRLAGFARPYLRRYAVGFVLLLVTNALGLWIPWLLRAAIRALEASRPLEVIVRIAATIAGVALAQAVVRTGSRWMILGASRRIVYDVRNLFFRRLVGLGPRFFDGQRTGDIMSRGVNDTRLVQGFFGPGVLNLLNTSIVYSAVLLLLLRLNVSLTLVALVLYPVLFFAVNRISRRVYSRSLEVQEQLAAISNRAQENISGMQQVKIYAQEEREIAAFRALSDDYRRRSLSMAALRGGMIALIGIVSGLGTLIVLFVGGRFVIQGRMELADFVAFNAYLAMLVWPTIALGWIINTIQRGLGAMRRIAEVFDHPQEVDPFESPTGEALDPVDGDIEIRNLSFAYPVLGRHAERTAPARPALRNVSLCIPRGSRVAIVGPVGSGKSTLANLLARFYPVPAGTIFIGGEDVNEIPLDRLRRSIGYVPQEAFLFSRSLRDNVAYGEPAAADAHVVDAVGLARLTGDLETLPEGLETRVGERGFTLSGGQRQRTTLARALVGNRPLLLLDDSLSSVDADTERAILNALEARSGGRTLMLITHRLTSVADMDRIIVLDQGCVVEQGTHEELLQRGGLYANLFRRGELERSLSAAPGGES